VFARLTTEASLPKLACWVSNLGANFGILHFTEFAPKVTKRRLEHVATAPWRNIHTTASFVFIRDGEAQEKRVPPVAVLDRALYGILHVDLHLVDHVFASGETVGHVFQQSAQKFLESCGV